VLQSSPKITDFLICFKPGGGEPPASILDPTHEAKLLKQNETARMQALAAGMPMQALAAGMPPYLAAAAAAAQGKFPAGFDPAAAAQLAGLKQQPASLAELQHLMGAGLHVRLAKSTLK